MISLKLDDENVSKNIIKLSSQLKNMRPIMQGIANIMKEGVRDNFHKTQSPDGSAWQAFSPVTLQIKAKQNKTNPVLLRDSTKLYGSIRYRTTKETAIVSTNRKQAALHHFGGMAGVNRKVKIPARPYMGLSDARIQEALKFIKEELLKTTN